MGLRGQLYAGDYDGYEIVNVRHLSDTVKRFQSNIKKLQGMANVTIGDIKAGEVPDWDILKGVTIKDGVVAGYKAVEASSALDTLKKAGIISTTEYNGIRPLIKASLTSADYYRLKDKAKFHIVRWTPSEVLAGHIVLRDGKTLTLADAIQMPAIVKLDVIGLVGNNRYTEFSAVYEFKKGKKVLNPTPSSKADMIKSLHESIGAYASNGNYFKVIKRLFSLAKLTGEHELLDKLEPILNSDLGRLYYITGDIGTLLDLIERAKRASLPTIRFEIDQFINRLANVRLPTIVGKSPSLNKEIRRIEKLGINEMSAPLEKLKESIDGVLQKNARPIAEEHMPKHGGLEFRLPLDDIQKIKEAKPADKEATIGKVYHTLKQSAHYYSWRNPPMAFAFRILADNVWDEWKKPDPKEASQIEHKRQHNTEAMRILNGDELGLHQGRRAPRDDYRLKYPSWETYYKAMVEPSFDRFKKQGADTPIGRRLRQYFYENYFGEPRTDRVDKKTGKPKEYNDNDAIKEFLERNPFAEAGIIEPDKTKNYAYPAHFGLVEGIVPVVTDRSATTPPAVTPPKSGAESRSWR
jgi:hypothetical protein